MIKNREREYTQKSFELHCDKMYYNELIGAHQHEKWDLDYIKHGYGIHTFNNISEPCKEDELILVPSNIMHSWIIDPVSIKETNRVETYSLFFDLNIIVSRFGFFPELLPCIEFLKKISQPIEILGKSANKIKRLLLYMAHKDDMYQLPAFLQILIELAENENERIIHIGNAKLYNSHAQNTIHKVYQYILDNYARHITLNEIADIAHMNKSAFCTFFKKHYTQNFFYVLNEHRINIACLMLSKESIKDIAEISIAVGFNDVPYFHRTFKKYKGCTPNEYRKKIKEYKESITL